MWKNTIYTRGAAVAYHHYSLFVTIKPASIRELFLFELLGLHLRNLLRFWTFIQANQENDQGWPRQVHCPGGSRGVVLQLQAD